MLQLWKHKRLALPLDLQEKDKQTLVKNVNFDKHFSLILTESAVSDVQAARAFLSAASNTPLSIAAMGIGNPDFSIIHDLDY